MLFFKSLANWNSPGHIFQFSNLLKNERKRERQRKRARQAETDRHRDSRKGMTYVLCLDVPQNLHAFSEVGPFHRWLKLEFVIDSCCNASIKGAKIEGGDQ